MSTYAYTPPCPCECNRGGFCGGCGHAGCSGGINVRRPAPRVVRECAWCGEPANATHGPVRYQVPEGGYYHDACADTASAYAADRIEEMGV